MTVQQITVGWREWVELPQLKIPFIKAKIDTGARSSAIHAFNVKPLVKKGIRKVKFSIHPLQGRTDVVIDCICPAVDHRWVSDSGGHREKRWVILTSLQMGQNVWEVEMTLTNRDNMKFRMLIGRTAMCNRLVVDPAKSYCTGVKPRSRDLLGAYLQYKLRGK